MSEVNYHIKESKKLNEFQIVVFVQISLQDDIFLLLFSLGIFSHTSVRCFDYLFDFGIY